MKERNDMFKLKVKQFGKWGDFVESHENKTPVLFNTKEEAEAVKLKRVDMFGPIYRVVEVSE